MKRTFVPLNENGSFWDYPHVEQCGQSTKLTQSDSLLPIALKSVMCQLLKLESASESSFQEQH